MREVFLFKNMQPCPTPTPALAVKNNLFYGYRTNVRMNVVINFNELIKDTRP